MNSKTAKLLRKIAPKLDKSPESVKIAFKKLDPIQQIAFVKKAKERLEYYEKRTNNKTTQPSI